MSENTNSQSRSNIISSENESRSGRTSRLPSIRPPRDLTLNSSVKRYVPNVNIRRQKHNKPVIPPKKFETTESVRKKEFSFKPERIYTPREYVQLPGCMFGEGFSVNSSKKGNVVDNINQSKKFAASSSKSASQVSRNVFMKKEPFEDSYLNDHFVDNEEENKKKSGPLILPIVLPTRKSFDDGMLSDDSDEMFLDTRPCTTPKEAMKKDEISLLESKLNDLSVDSGDLFLLEFPSQFPWPKPESGSPDREQSSRDQKMTLKDLSEGLIGKLQIFKSGNHQFIFNNIRFNVVKVPVASCQDLLCVQTEEKLASLTNLGHIKHVWKLVPVISVS